MVCLGNICRSPLAEGILKSKVKEKNLAWEVDSAGTSSWHQGELPDKRSISVAQKYGIDITDQRSRPITSGDLDYFDKIYVMDAANYRDVMELTENTTQRLKIEMIMNLVHPGYNTAVPDPYWDDNGFEKIFDMLNTAANRIIEQFSDN